MVQKVINAKAMAGLRSIIIIWDSAIYCPQGHCTSNSIGLKVQTQETTAKDFSCPEKHKTKDLKSVSPRDDLAEPAKKEDK